MSESTMELPDIGGDYNSSEMLGSSVDAAPAAAASPSVAAETTPATTVDEPQSKDESSELERIKQAAFLLPDMDEQRPHYEKRDPPSRSPSFIYFPRTPPNSKATSEEQFSAAHKRILCVGMCTLDIVHVCEQLPREGDKACLSEGYWQRNGNASNNCTVLCMLGAECEFLGVLSNVPAFKFLIDDCEQRGIIVEHCPLVEIYPPFSSIVTCKASGMFQIIHTNMGFPILRYDTFLASIMPTRYSWVHFEGRNVAETKSMINMIRRHNAQLESNEKPVTISVELAKTDIDLLSLAMRADLVFMGREFAINLGWSAVRVAVFNLASLLTTMQLREVKSSDEEELCFRIPHIVCPWSNQGCSVLSTKFDYRHIPCSLRVSDVVDSRGSGDTFVAGTIYAMDRLKLEVRDAVQLAYRMAEYKMKHRGLDCVEEFKNINNI